MQHWVFGYGSLIWRVDFPYHERHRAAVRGWCRRFWQGSHDHRGLPHAPGRVVTLVREPDAVCIGAAYRVEEAVFEHLDHREKNGYERVSVTMQLAREGCSETTKKTVDGVTYIAAPGNEAFLGPADVDEMARHIARSSGPSGTNADYLLELAAALDDLGCEDHHVRDLVCRVRTATDQ
ncbi:MAG: gamma-glutamylcyclotransferase [Pseudomonadales bacterium]|nr:gamma-glutamylcyclotransferase [Pseudomonadales bacterium]